MPSDRLSQTFAALADPTRRAILGRLLRGARTVTELAEPFDMSLPAISKHLQVLERSGLVKRSRDAQRRPCRLNAKPLGPAASWLASYIQLERGRFDRSTVICTSQRKTAATSGQPKIPPCPSTSLK